MFRKSAIALSFILACLSQSAFSGDVADAIDALAAGEHRSEKNQARNQFRNPGKTLEFLGLRSDMTVVEISPGGGWYTEVLAPYLKAEGEYIAGSYDPESDSNYAKRGIKRYAEKLAAHPSLYSDVKVTVFSAPDKMNSAPQGSADMVLTFRNMHSFMRSGNQKTALEGMFDLLKPGGVLGVVAHRGDANAEQDPKGGKGYIKQSIIVDLAKSVGFVLEASSEINANAKDTQDHPGGVWNLPPSLSGDAADREKFVAIGESDRMTLRFRKP